MSDFIEVYVIVEGVTEQTFIRDILSPYMGQNKIYLYPVLIGKPGHKGGNVHFDRAVNDIEKLLKERSSTYISTMLDYYGINSKWPGRDNKDLMDVRSKADSILKQTSDVIAERYPELDIKRRFIPYFSMHEFEAILFSGPKELSNQIGIQTSKITNILNKVQTPEEINDNPATSPSKRIGDMSKSAYKKTIDGIAIAKSIGIPIIREKCPLFDNWIIRLEKLSPLQDRGS